MTKAELTEKAKDLGASDGALEGLTNKEIEALIVDLENGDEDNKGDTPDKKPVDFYEDDRGLKWEFTAKAPKTINIDGRPMGQSEILQTEEVVSELVYGNSNFLIRKTN